MKTNNMFCPKCSFTYGPDAAGPNKCPRCSTEMHVNFVPPLPCRSGDTLAEMNCPHMKSCGSDSQIDYYHCKVCDKRYTTHDSEIS